MLATHVWRPLSDSYGLEVFKLCAPLDGHINDQLPQTIVAASFAPIGALQWLFGDDACISKTTNCLATLGVLGELGALAKHPKIEAHNIQPQMLKNPSQIHIEGASEDHEGRCLNEEVMVVVVHGSVVGPSGIIVNLNPIGFPVDRGEMISLPISPYFTIPHIIHMDSTGFHWIPLDSTGLHYILAISTKLDSQHKTGLHWTASTNLDWTGLDWTANYKTGFHWTLPTQNWTGLDCHRPKLIQNS
ncbi:uncharacterized protein LACBIDRAFT_331508 [Laccaria bicolor S238N-H82]|uniref:Predicted protein n=1 Tax=Laccaria bicolor (strain S238N-H82 / ATCC MYA-4686) TaxID=486041 RepID=B0DPP1_LACBS|nr:uncharacterized protein LACBIDRAFT_331508 [Laccaria bicolor S238N-H82]EDR03410.1 predicted protein [Laccaria bicolor S238N-H82]|eukprot:XP_001885866.1 predicted protein [Laccaria bicolor S238N-H82]